jgi:hypothetical protein
LDKEEILREASEDALLIEARERRFLYADVEALIEEEFLSHPVEIGGQTIVLRGMLPRDQQRLRARSRLLGPGEALRWTVSSSIWMVGGFEVPPGEANGAWHIHQTLMKDLHFSYVEVLASVLAGLQNRFQRALRLVEAYCYEPYSRGLWRMLGKPSEGLGNANTVRRLWVAHNLAEDKRASGMTQWAHTRALVSSLSSKGGKQLGKALDGEDTREESRRQKVVEDTVNWIIRGDREPEKVMVKFGGREVEVARIHAAQSTHDLEEEMRRVMSGEPDLHDMMVNQYHQGVRDLVESKAKERQEKIRQARQRADAAEEAGMPALTGYTKSQLEKLNPSVLEHRATVQTSDTAQSSYMFDRYFRPNLKAGELTPNLKVEDAHHAKKATSPEDSPSLQERVQGRSPQLRSEDGQ